MSARTSRCLSDTFPGPATTPWERKRSRVARATSLSSPLAAASSIASLRTASAFTSSAIRFRAVPSSHSRSARSGASTERAAARPNKPTAAGRSILATARLPAESKSSAARRPSRARARRAGRAPGGSGTPAPDGSPPPPRVRAREPRTPAASQAPNRSWRSARTSFGTASYAASRIRTWRKRNASSPANDGWSGRISSRRRRAARWRSTCPPSSGPQRSRTAPRWKTLPSIDARSSDRPLVGVELIEPCREERLDARRNGHRRQIGRRHPPAVA